MDYTRYTSLTAAAFTSVPPTITSKLSIPFFRKCDELKVVLCTTCGLALGNRDYIRKHLKQHHAGELEAGLDLARFFDEIQDDVLLDYHDLPAIPADTFFLAELPLVFTTYKCPDCVYFSLSSKASREHRIKVHGQKAREKQK